MGSGLEKFVLSLATRVCTHKNILIYHVPNFIAIDEGFGCADKDNLEFNASAIIIIFSVIHFDFYLGSKSFWML
jgi:DNA repair exonuclease SbcCD ATPase subunit